MSNRFVWEHRRWPVVSAGAPKQTNWATAGGE